MTPEFRIDQTVRVLHRPRDGGGDGHVRTPAYLRGRTGRIIDIAGSFPDPAVLARGGLGLPYRTLYRVAFRSDALWSGQDHAPADEVVADLYEHWLVPQEVTDAT